MADSDAVVSLENVTVTYGRNQALAEVTTTFERGAVGLLGPNGAGKSTMIKSLLGFVAPSQGRMRVLGMDVATSPIAIRARIGYMPENDAHIPGMNAVSFVAYCGELAGLPRTDAMQRAHEVLFYVGLGEARYRNVETYSTGMKQRIKLAQALVHDPDLLFLDEPTNGMDPKGRDEMLELVRDLAHNKGVNLILSSHLLPDVEYTCDQVVVMDKGRIEQAGTPQQVYDHPRTPFVHEFIGESIVVPVIVEAGDVRFDGRSTGLDPRGAPNGKALLFARPFEVTILPSSGENQLTGTVTRIHGIGAARRVEIALGKAHAETTIEVDALRTQQLRVGQLVGVRPEQYRLFPAAGSSR